MVRGPLRRIRSSRSRGDGGFSLALALLVVLAGLTTTLAITARTIGSRQVRDSDDKSFSARNAAEIGMTRIVSELNRPRNRRLLVNAPGLGATGATTTTIGDNDDFRSACDLAAGEGPDLSGQGTFASGAVLNNEVTIPNTNNRLHYKLVRIVNGDPAVGSFPDPNLSEQDADGDANTSFRVTLGNGATPVTPGVSGRITVDVTGRAVDAAGKESLYHLRKTFAVIPKCCGSSFGGFKASGDADLWGNDERTDCGVASGYGLILGSRRDHLTNADTRGSLASQIAIYLQRTLEDNTTTNSTVNRVYCTVNSTNPVSADCPLSTTLASVRTKLFLKDISLPPVPVPASTGDYTFTGTKNTLTEFTTTRPAASTRAQIFWNQSTVSGSTVNTCSTGPCSVSTFARMRVCDASVSDNQTNNPPWLGASNRALQTAVLSSTAPVPGCRITATSSETLNTREFDDWDTEPGNTLKWHLGRLCQKVRWPWPTAINPANTDTIYCSLSSLSVGSGFLTRTITFDTAGQGPNTSIPIILSFANGNSTLRKIDNISRPSGSSGNNVLRVRVCTSADCAASGSTTVPFATGDQVVIRDLPHDDCDTGSPVVRASSFNNDTSRPTYTVSSVGSGGDVNLTRTSMPTINSSACNGTTAFRERSGTIVEVGNSLTMANSSQSVLDNATLHGGTIRNINTQRTSDRGRLTDMMILGCALNQTPSCRFQDITAGGLFFRLTDVFIYAPYARMRTSGYLQYTGAYWGNKLDQTVSLSFFTIPSGSIDSVVSAFPGWTPAALDLEQDYVARQVIRVGTFDPN